MSLILRVNARLVNPCKHQLIWLDNIIFKTTESSVLVNYSYVCPVENIVKSYDIKDRLKNLEMLREFHKDSGPISQARRTFTAKP